MKAIKSEFKIKLELTETELGVLRLHTQVSMARLLGRRMKCSALESVLEKLEDAKEENKNEVN